MLTLGFLVLMAGIVIFALTRLTWLALRVIFRLPAWIFAALVAFGVWLMWFSR